MATPLLNTKLFLPPIHPDRVERGRLLARLDEVLRPGVRAGLISAPAGFGKTSLLSEWIARRGKPCAWLALDAGDNAPALFLAYFLAAIERARPGLLHETALMLKAAQSGAEPAPAPALLATLINELSALDPSDPLVIALDDFQFITAGEPREMVAFLIENLPPGVRLVIATRADPPLPLARLRARRQVLELRAADLRFTPAEAAAFLIDVMGLRFDPQRSQELVDSLTSRTEGWIAGLQMAALALQSAPEADAAEFIRSFTGSNRYVLDYLAEEVLARLPEEISTFLLQTSILDRFCASLCEEVTGEEVTSSELLSQRVKKVMSERLESQQGREEAPSSPFTHNSLTSNSLLFTEKNNLFLVPLDGERVWFRYHHLFADLLRARLKQTWPERLPLLHRRASLWFERSGLVLEAIQHALAAGVCGQDAADYERAAQLVENHTLALLKRGELHTLNRWVDLLPRELASQRPWFCIYRAWVLVFSGQVEPVEGLLRQVEAGVEHMGEAERRLIEGHCAAVRTQRGIVTNQVAEVYAAYAAAAEQLPEDEWARGVADWAYAYALRMKGELDQAAAIFEKLLHNTRTSGDNWAMAMMGTDLTVVRKAQGQLRQARIIAEAALNDIDQRGARKFGYVGRLLTAYATVLYELNELEAAQKVLEEAVELNQRWRNPNHLVYASLNLARVRAAQGDFSAAQELVELAEAQARQQPLVATLTSSLSSTRTTLQLAQGQPPPVDGALETAIQGELAASEQTTGSFSEITELRRLHLARLLLAHGRADDALRLAAAVEQAARAAGRMGALLEALTLKALASYAQGMGAEALQLLGEALTLAEPEGAVRAIIDMAPLLPGALETLLQTLQNRARGGRSNYPARLLLALRGSAAAEALDAFGAAHPRPVQVPHPTQAAKPKSPLIENLSERELEVLGLLAAGLTNAQIAERLVISTGTVKAHTANIFRKLDAANRTQAVAKAREYGLIP